MVHIHILIALITLLIGGLSASRLLFLYRVSGKPCLKSLFRAGIGIDVIVVTLVIEKYFKTNLFHVAYTLGIDLPRILDIVLSGIELAAAFATIWFLSIAVLEIRSAAMPSGFKTGFRLAALLAASAFSVGATIYAVNNDHRIMFLATDWAEVIALILCMFGLASSIWAGKVDQATTLQRMSRALAAGYLIGFAAIIVVFFLPWQSRDFLVLLVLLLLNLYPLIWIQRFFRPADAHAPSLPRGIESNRWIQQYNISEREADVLELLLTGKSNREIENALFISIHTVKNHIYNLYRKIGVKSRGQLVQRFLEENRD